MRAVLLFLPLFAALLAAGCSSTKDGPIDVERCPGGGTKCVIRGNVPF